MDSSAEKSGRSVGVLSLQYIAVCYQMWRANMPRSTRIMTEDGGRIYLSILIAVEEREVCG